MINSFNKLMRPTDEEIKVMELNEIMFVFEPTSISNFFGDVS